LIQCALRVVGGVVALEPHAATHIESGMGDILLKSALFEVLIYIPAL
jgi:hypothetical protein